VLGLLERRLGNHGRTLPDRKEKRLAGTRPPAWSGAVAASDSAGARRAPGRTEPVQDHVREAARRRDELEHLLGGEVAPQRARLLRAPHEPLAGLLQRSRLRQRAAALDALEQRAVPS